MFEKPVKLDVFKDVPASEIFSRLSDTRLTEELLLVFVPISISLLLLYYIIKVSVNRKFSMELVLVFLIVNSATAPVLATSYTGVVLYRAAEPMYHTLIIMGHFSFATPFYAF